MEEWISKLLAVLAVEERVHRQLRALLAEERDRMLALDAEALHALATRKEILADEGRLAEGGRIELVSRLAEALEFDDTPPTLSRLCESLGEQAAPLRSAQRRLVAAVGAVRELAEANRVLGGERLAHVQTTLQLLGRLSPTLDKSGPGESGSLLRTSA